LGPLQLQKSEPTYASSSCSASVMLLTWRLEGGGEGGASADIIFGCVGESWLNSSQLVNIRYLS